MAGDISIHEEAIVGAGADTRNVDELAEIVGEGGGAIHQYGRQVLIAAVPPDDRAREVVERQAPGATVTAEAGAISEAARSGLEEVEALGLEAFALRQSDEYAAVKSQRPLDGEPWDTEEATTPDLSGYAVAEAPEVAEAVPAGARLGGRVAVGIIIVEGPTAHNLQFSAAERTQVVAEVQNGLGWLGSAAKFPYTARVTWVYDIQRVTLNVTPNYPTGSYEAMEAPWRNPAMQQLGFEASFAGVQAYVEGLRRRLNTASAYCAFFTKYPLRHFGYASINGPRLVMHYDNDGWGPDNIDRVFAHETGHIFGAPDEYAASNCTCGGEWGFLRQPNANCVTCAPGGGVDCIMKANTWQMCDYTPLHLGLDVKVPSVS